MKNKLTSKPDDRSEIFTNLKLTQLTTVLEQQDYLILLSSKAATDFLELNHSKLLGNVRGKILNLLEDIDNLLMDV